MDKNESDAINEFDRVKAREDMFLKKLVPPPPVTNAELDGPCVNDEKNPMKRRDEDVLP